MTGFVEKQCVIQHLSLKRMRESDSDHIDDDDNDHALHSRHYALRTQPSQPLWDISTILFPFLQMG